MTLLDMSISGAVIIMVIVLIRALAINRLPKKTFLFLWGVALCRLLIPFHMPSPFSAYNLIQQGTETSQMQTGNMIALVSPVTPLPIGTPFAEFVENPINIPLLVWFSGAFLLTAYFSITYILFRREFQMALPVKNEYVKNWLAQMKMKRTITIRQSSRISAPLTYGIWKPIILMPKHTNWEDSKQINYVLAHELVHIRRFDTVTKLLLTAVLCIHWFNPLVWVMYILSNRDIELSCDETVVRSFGDTSKSAYARTLISMEESKNRFTPLCNNFSKNAIEERITAIMKTKRTTVFTLALAFLIIMGTTGAFATSSVASNNHTESAFTSTKVDTNLYSAYIPFGLTINEQTGKLYYEDNLVRCFDDQIPTENFSAKGIGYYEEKGVIDIRAIRDNSNSTSKLIGLEVLSSSEFQNRVITDPTKPSAKSGTDIFDEYEVYDLSFDKSQNALFYNGERVRLFMDIRNSNGKPVDSEEFLGSTTSNLDPNGTIDVYAIRDYSKINKNGAGELTGLRTATSEEFDENTKSFGQTTRNVESAK